MHTCAQAPTVAHQAKYKHHATMQTPHHIKQLEMAFKDLEESNFIPIIHNVRQCWTKVTMKNVVAHVCIAYN